MGQLEIKHLSHAKVIKTSFHHVKEEMHSFHKESFRKLGEKEKSEKVNGLLLRLIQKSPASSFLLSSVIDYIDLVNREKILDHYTFSNFELWLNQFSTLSVEENYQIRAKIVGKWIPREEYQVFFPIGMGKMYAGSHVVTAHQSPDLDTTIASFWGWVDAFGARVSEGVHIWNLPGGPNVSQVELGFLFSEMFGEGIFTYLPKSRTTLSLTGLELLSQKGVLKKEPGASMLHIDHQRNQNAVILVDEQGYYLGDWRSFDVEGVRQIMLLFNECLRWLENELHLKFISLFSKEELSLKDIPSFLQSVSNMQIGKSTPMKNFTEKQKQHIEDFLNKVLHVKKGLQSSLKEFAFSMKNLGIMEFQGFMDLLENMPESSLFDKKGSLKEDRPKIFHFLQKVLSSLSLAIESMHNYLERLDTAFSIKTKVLGYLPQFVTSRADVEEIKGKMGNYPYLTVTYSDPKGGLVPLGIVNASDLHKPTLGTVSLRDFCNREETKIPSYLEVISVIDHHKAALTTLSAPMAMIADTQSSNVLVAQIAFTLNDKYSTGGMSDAEIQKQIKQIKNDLGSAANQRILQRLLQRSSASSKKNGFFVSPLREFAEYLHFIYAIFDDTDLLTKMSFRDIEIIVSLLNRLKSLSLKKEVEILSLDDIPQDDNFVCKATQRILQHKDVYSLYQKIYLAKEEAVEHSFKLCLKGKPSSVFADTKEQNGCCRVGQTKMFLSNLATFKKHASELRVIWYEESALIYKEKKEVDLHLHMITTIAGAEDRFAGTQEAYQHKDEIWIWIPAVEPAVEHLKNFLSALKNASYIQHNQMEVEFLGENAKELKEIFVESFIPIPYETSSHRKKNSLPIAVLRFKAGSINSRKAQISPYLPTLVV